MSDSPNLNNWQHDYNEWWNAFKDEQEAKNDALEAEKKMERNDALQSLGTELSAAGDWTQAKWDEFKAKASKWSNEAEMNIDESI